MPSVIFLNFAAEPQSAVGSTQELRTDYSKMKKLAHYNFKLDETGVEFSKRVENTVEKGVFKYLCCINVKTMASLGHIFRFVDDIILNLSSRW